MPKFPLTPRSALLPSISPSGFAILALVFYISPAMSAPLFINPSYFCYGNAVVIWNLIVFYTTNFIAHAASVPLSADVGRFTQRVTDERPVPWAVIISFFLPFGGLVRAILLIVQQLKWKDDDTHASLAHGALHILARTEDWGPRKSMEELVYVKLPDKYEEISVQQAAKTYAAFELITEGETHWTVDHNHRNLFGEISVPPGYALAAPSNKAVTENIISLSLEPTSNIKIPRPQSVLKVIASIVQIIAASITIYLSLGDQITRFGYAAYGLTVFPYALMSFVNMICAGIVGDFSCGHILRTPILHEAEQRGGFFNGSIGRLKNTAADLETTSTSGFKPVLLSVRPSVHGTPDTLVVRDAKEAKEFLYSPGAAGGASNKVTFGFTPVTHDGPAGDERLAQFNHVSMWEIVSVTGSFGIMMILPYVLMYTLTQFAVGQSTAAERVLVMSWLVADQLSALATLASWFIWKRWGEVIPTSAYHVGVTALMLPAIGGLAMIGYMFMKDRDFGACTSS